jgi:hypothetical protein
MSTCATFHFPYLLPDWRAGGAITPRVWFARLDLSKFFPSIGCQQVQQRLMRELTGLPGFDPVKWKPVLSKWLRFSEDCRGISVDALGQFPDERVVGGGLPVGLVASGFLANVYMMEVDRDIEHRLARKYRGNVAVLRYVDDFLIVADDRGTLCRWLTYRGSTCYWGDSNAIGSCPPQ